MLKNLFLMLHLHDGSKSTLMPPCLSLLILLLKKDLNHLKQRSGVQCDGNGSANGKGFNYMFVLMKWAVTYVVDKIENSVQKGKQECPNLRLYADYKVFKILYELVHVIINYFLLLELTMNRDPNAYRYKWSNWGKKFQKNLKHLIIKQESSFQVVFIRTNYYWNEKSKIIDKQVFLFHFLSFCHNHCSEGHEITPSVKVKFCCEMY